MSCFHYIGHCEWLVQQVATSLECHFCWHCKCYCFVDVVKRCLIAFTTLFTRLWCCFFSCSKTLWFMFAKIHFSNRKQTSSTGIGYEEFFRSHLCNLSFKNDKLFSNEQFNLNSKQKISELKIIQWKEFSRSDEVAWYRNFYWNSYRFPIQAWFNRYLTVLTT